MKKVIPAILAILMSGFVATAPVMAGKCTCSNGKEGVETIILGTNGCSCDDGNGSEIYHILKLVLDIMSVGVAIFAVIGITISGIQYMTAGGSEEKTRKAKRRIFEIVIGIAVYVVIYALLSWFLPNFDDSMNRVENAQNNTSSIVISKRVD